MTFTPLAPKPGVPSVLQLAAVPNPQTGTTLGLAFELKADAISVIIKLYSAAMTVIEKKEVPGAYHAGWNACSVVLAAPPVNGLHYVVVEARSNTASGESAVAKVYYLQ